ncbi:MAG: helix-turn-helix domain-containing protein [Clostridia bacterium]|nr:helix-turn-helix domain-containing protein [Clostridia bacterium]
MENVDIRYICTTVGNLTGVPVRVYRDGRVDFCYSVVDLPKDPADMYLDNFVSVTDHIGYYAADFFQYYGIVNSGEIKIVIGPSSGELPKDQDLRELAFKNDVPAEYAQDYISGLKSIHRMPLQNILQLLCTLNYLLNGEKKALRDVAIYDKEQEALSLASSRNDAEARFEYRENIRVHNTYDLENLLMDMIRKGDTAALREWLSAAPAVGGGDVGPNLIRQHKNIFIVTATLASRAAIRGGMMQEDAFNLSDEYIQKCEMLENLDRITNLQYHMILDFTERVESLHRGKNSTKLVTDVANYVRHHLSEPISVESMAEEFYISRPYLSAKFRKETGQTLTDFILSEKTEEAKRLLRYSDKSLLSISEYLGFSSQSHFIRVFKKYAGANPGEYREKHKV